jgi:hypothetical protein
MKDAISSLQFYKYVIHFIPALFRIYHSSNASGAVRLWPQTVRIVISIEDTPFLKHRLEHVCSALVENDCEYRAKRGLDGCGQEENSSEKGLLSTLNIQMALAK